VKKTLTAYLEPAFTTQYRQMHRYVVRANIWNFRRFSGERWQDTGWHIGPVDCRTAVHSRVAG